MILHFYKPIVCILYIDIEHNHKNLQENNHKKYTVMVNSWEGERRMGLERSILEPENVSAIFNTINKENMSSTNNKS